MKKERLFKKIVVILIFILCSIGIILFLEKTSKLSLIENIKRVISKQIQEDGAISNVDTTVVDVTGLVIGEETEHEHIYKTMYDGTQHWEECIACKNKRNEMAHSFTTTWANGVESCYYTNSYTKVCTCGYSETGHKPCVWDGSSYITNMYWHVKLCSSCKSRIVYSYWLNDVLYENSVIDPKYVVSDGIEYCHSIDGRKLSCNNYGTCVRCGYVWNREEHSLFSNPNTGRIYCRYCNQEFGTYSEKITIINSSGPATYRVEGTFKLEGNAWLYSKDDPGNVQNENGYPWNYQYHWVESLDDTWQNFTVVSEMQFQNQYKTSFDTWFHTYINVNGVKADFGTMLEPPHVFYSDLVEPTIDSITINEESSSSEWNKNKTITISGTENYTNTIDIQILDDKNKEIYTGTANNDWSGWSESTPYGRYSISCTPELEASAEGRTFKAIVTDTCENKIEKEFTVSKIDAIAPEIKSGNEVGGDWAKEKNFTFEATDRGIGNVQIAFNDVTDYELANKSGDSYLRDYKFVGDVYEPTEARVFYKDGLGNISTQVITLNKIDNTSPIIVNANVHNNKLNVVANDVKEGLGEGSGVVKYRYITSSEKITNPSVDNVKKEVGKDEEFIIENIDKVKYIYVVAEDLVRKYK